MKQWMATGMVIAGLLWGGWCGRVMAQTLQPPELVRVSVTADHLGNVWMAQVRRGQIWVSSSIDAGQHFGKEVAVNARAMHIITSATERPNIAVAPNGMVYLSWTETLAKSEAGHIWFARSVNGGKSFEPPLIVHRDRAETLHRYDVLHVAADGTVMVSWIDKRDMLLARAEGRPYLGAAIYYAVSADHGRTFTPEQKLIDHSCECCRMAVTSKPDSTVALLWRHVFEGNERDHAMLEIGRAGKAELVRASYNRWRTDECAQHGKALAVGEGFGYHLAFFEGAGERPGLRIARMDGQNWLTSPPRKIGDASRQAGYPALLSQGDKVWLAWHEQSGERMDVIAITSLDGGKTWGLPLKVAHGEHGLDVPQWLYLQGQVWLAVYNAEQGLQVLPVPSR